MERGEALHTTGRFAGQRSVTVNNLIIETTGKFAYHLNLADSGSSSSIAEEAIIAVLAAILGFASAYALYQIQRRNESHKQLSWEIQTVEAQLEVSSEIKERVSVLYRETKVENLTAVKYVFSNTGNRALKKEQIRFNFGDQVQVLEHSLFPKPEPELGVVQVNDHGLTSLDYVYRIGLLEVGQQVKFLFVLASHNPITSLKPHATSEEGDVKFIRQGTERTVADQEHVKPFLLALFAFLVVPLVLPVVLSPLNNDEFSFNFQAVALAVARIALLIPLLPHLAPVARLTQQLVAHYLSVTSGTEVETENTVGGGQFYGPVLQGRGFSHITFAPPVEATEPDEPTGEPD